MLLEQASLRLDQVKVLAHEQAHCGGVQSEAVSDICDVWADQKVAVLLELL